MNGTCTLTFLVLTRMSGTCSNRDARVSIGLLITDHNSLTSDFPTGLMLSHFVLVTRFFRAVPAGVLPLASLSVSHAVTLLNSLKSRFWNHCATCDTSGNVTLIDMDVRLLITYLIWLSSHFWMIHFTRPWTFPPSIFNFIGEPPLRFTLSMFSSDFWVAYGTLSTSNTHRYVHGCIHCCWLCWGEVDGVFTSQSRDPERAVKSSGEIGLVFVVSGMMVRHVLVLVGNAVSGSAGL